MRYEQKTWDTSWWTHLSSRRTREPCQISWKPGWFRPKTSRPDKATGLHDFETAFCKNVSRERGWKHKSRGENSSLPSPSWQWVRTSAISCFQKVLTATKRVKSLISSDLSCQRPYHAECTGSRPITEVKQHRASSVLGWETAWEHGVLLAQIFFISLKNRLENLSNCVCYRRGKIFL